MSLYLYSLELPLFHLLELKAYDFKVSLRGTRPVSDRVVIVAIDEKSLKKDGRWPWPRTRLAKLVDKLSNSGVAAIGLDLLFPEKDIYIPLNEVKNEIGKKDLFQDQCSAAHSLVLLCRDLQLHPKRTESEDSSRCL